MFLVAVRAEQSAFVEFCSSWVCFVVMFFAFFFVLLCFASRIRGRECVVMIRDATLSESYMFLLCFGWTSQQGGC